MPSGCNVIVARATPPLQCEFIRPYIRTHTHTHLYLQNICAQVYTSREFAFRSSTGDVGGGPVSVRDGRHFAISIYIYIYTRMYAGRRVARECWAICLSGQLLRNCSDKSERTTVTRPDEAGAGHPTQTRI